MTSIDATGPDDREPIDADIVDLLNESIAPQTMDAALAARVKHRLLQRIAEDQCDRHLTVQGHQGPWQPLGPGLQMKLLHEAGGILSYLVRLAPGASLAPHRHPVDEECVVLEGELQIGELRLTAGGFHLGRRDVLHGRITTVGGALIFLRGAAPEIGLLI